MTHDRDPSPTEKTEAGHHRGILGILPVAGNRCEVFNQRIDILQAVGSIRMAGNLRFLPRRQAGIDIRKRLIRLALQPADFFVNRNGIAFLGDGAQFLDLALKIGNRLFEVEIGKHWPQKHLRAAETLWFRPPPAGRRQTGVTPQ